MKNAILKLKNFFRCDKEKRKKKDDKQNDTKPQLTVPESSALSPCLIEPYTTTEDNQTEENKGYIPVSLLMRAIEDDSIRNIAVTGNYGVGKSSVIKTAEKELQKHRFINISLASLLVSEHLREKKDSSVDTPSKPKAKVASEPRKKDDAPDNGASGDSNLKTIAESVTYKQIEYSILQQILYHDKPQSTPKSRIKRIHRTEKKKPFVVAFLGILSVFSLFVLGDPELSSFSENFLLGEACDLWIVAAKWIALLSLVVVICVVCNYVGTHYNLMITHLGAKGVEMKFKDDLSVLNAYLDEIVYFFESTDYDVVVFEDLDRFEDREVIFYKLRELNTILNGSKSIGRKISFVYAVLDDLFDAEERVKFFDYIVTVIPVINSLNSYNKLKERIHSPELFEKLGQNELLVLCDYLYDMRLLLNVVNEFNQFIPLLVDAKEMSEKVLLGLVVYKNYIPSDFSKMYNRQGVVANAIENAGNYRKEIIRQKQNDIMSYSQGIEKLKADLKTKIISIRKSYLEGGASLMGFRVSSIRVDGKDYLIDRVAEDVRLFDLFRRGKAAYLANGRLYNTPEFSDIERNVSGNDTYDGIIKSNQADINGKIFDLQEKINQLKLEVEPFPNNVSLIYKTAPEQLDSELAQLKDETKRNLVKFLILNGYLDHHYQYYLSYFYPNSLKRGDNTFVMHASRYEENPYDIELENIGEVIKRFDVEDYASNLSLQNISLFREIFAKKQFKDYRQRVCQLVLKGKSLGFLSACYRSTPAISDEFYVMLLKMYDYWSEIETRSSEDQVLLIEIYIRYCDIREGKVNLAFREWLTNNFSFIDERSDVITTRRILELLNNCRPVFSSLSLKKVSDDVVKEIVEKKLYVFTRKNFGAVIKRYGFYDEYLSASYTSILKKKIAPLRIAVEGDWATALVSVFPETSKNEGDAAMLAILSQSNTHKNEVRTYLSKQRKRIRNADLISDENLWYAFYYCLVEPTWRNIYYYSVTKDLRLPKKMLGACLIETKVSDELSSAQEVELRNMIVFSNEVPFSCYEKLVPLFRTPFDSIPSGISAERMSLLVENNYLEMNESNYRIVKHNYPSLASAFLLNNMKTFITAPDMYDVGEDDVVYCLKRIESKAGRSAFVRAIKSKALHPTNALVALIVRRIIDNEIKVSDINPALLPAVISSAPSDKRVALGRRALLSIPYDADLTKAILKAMGGDIVKLNSSSASSTISYSRDVIMVINYLQSNGFIESSYRKGDKIVVEKR